MLELVSGLTLGGVAGWFVRRYKEPKAAIVNPVKSPEGQVIFPPNMAEGTYEVRLNGRVLYRGNDLDKAKKEFKSLNLPKGIAEIYTNGNHTASREV